MYSFIRSSLSSTCSLMKSGSFQKLSLLFTLFIFPVFLPCDLKKASDILIYIRYRALPLRLRQFIPKCIELRRIIIKNNDIQIQYYGYILCDRALSKYQRSLYSVLWARSTICVLIVIFLYRISDQSCLLTSIFEYSHEQFTLRNTKHLDEANE